MDTGQQIISMVSRSMIAAVWVQVISGTEQSFIGSWLRWGWQI